VLSSGQILTLSPLATITLEVDSIGAHAPFPELLPLFKRILQVVFCEAVQHRLQSCLHRFNCVKMAAFLSYLQSGTQKKVEQMWDRSRVVYSKNSSGEKECETLICSDARDSSLVSKVCEEVIAHFDPVAIKCTNGTWN
jgi:hypothetical protein